MERITQNSQMTRWNDHIPLQWKYTAGVAGERFLQLLKQGKIQASVCRNCNRLYLPPKIFCKDCFAQLSEWRDVPIDGGYLYSFTAVGGETIALVKFDGVDGGLLGRLRKAKEEPRIGMKVKVVFKGKEERRGDISDIEYFERVNL
jgi:uncharacterized OB-fold protein